ncbi:MAG: single-stranded DNA-binding protein [Candidatus Helarchaeota archaeon]
MTENVEEFKIIDDLRPGLRAINIKIKCNSKNEEREVTSRKTGESLRVTEALVGDETGSIYLTLWNTDIDKMEIDHVYKLTNVYTTVFKGSLRLNIGKYGSFEELNDEEINDVNTENNLSDKIYDQPRRYRSSGGYGGSKYGGGGGYGGGGRRSYKGNRRGSYGKKRY